MNDRRRFLHVLSASVVSAAAAGACNDLEDPPPGEGAAGSSGAGGAGGAGGGASAGSGGDAAGAGGVITEPESVCGLTGKKIHNVGPPSAYASLGLHKVMVPKTAVLIGRDADGVYALTSICTHMQCDMNQPHTLIPGGEFQTGGDIMPDGGIFCYCHGSRYNEDGTVMIQQIAGQQRLQAFAISLCEDGNLYVDTGTQVDPRFRLPTP
jgi:Rieske Fe-S protein